MTPDESPTAPDPSADPARAPATASPDAASDADTAASAAAAIPPRLAHILHPQAVRIAARDYELLFVRNIDALLDALPGDAEIPYWSVLWESAIALSTWIFENPERLRDAHVLELGAGLGLCGMAAAEVGARVVQTDNHIDSLRVAAENARRNGLAPPAQFLADWRRWDHDVRYDILIGSDIVYERPVHDPLMRIFRRNLKPGGLLMLADPCRESGWEMAQRLEREGWRVELDPRVIDWENKRTEILMLRAVAGGKNADNVA